MSASFEITYAAHTSSCTFLLDAEGICRRIVVAPSNKRSVSSAKGRDSARLAARCVGAQYVASLDATVSGMLAEMPRVGSAMLFARVDERGRVSLVRTGIVTRFETHRAEDPFVETERVPSVSVETSAPVLAPPVPAPRASHTAPIAQDPYEEDAIDRTQPIQALRPDVLRSLHTPAAHDLPIDDDVTLDRTAEYGSERATLPAPRNEGNDVHDASAPTLRQPHAFGPSPGDESGPYGPYGRATLPRQTAPEMARAAAPRHAELGRSPRPVIPAPAERVAGRGRDR